MRIKTKNKRTEERNKKSMVKLNESITGYDLAELLGDENGIFEAISPNGERYQVVTRVGQSIVHLRSFARGNEYQSSPKTWQVRKIGELRSEQETTRQETIRQGN